MKFDLCQKNRAEELLLSESMRSSVSLSGQIFVMVNIFR